MRWRSGGGPDLMRIPFGSEGFQPVSQLQLRWVRPGEGGGGSWQHGISQKSPGGVRF